MHSQTCRSLPNVLDLCYCCGGVRRYHIYGNQCRRWCRRARDSHGPDSEPCRPTPEAEAENNNPDHSGAFPDYPTRLNIANIVCKGERRYEQLFGGQEEEEEENRQQAEQGCVTSCQN